MSKKIFLLIGILFLILSSVNLIQAEKLNIELMIEGLEPVQEVEFYYDVPTYSTVFTNYSITPYDIRIIEGNLDEELPSCNPADIDHDGDVDGVDRASFNLKWNPGGPYCGYEDLDQDGDVDGVDLAALGQAWNQGGIGLPYPCKPQVLWCTLRAQLLSEDNSVLYEESFNPSFLILSNPPQEIDMDIVNLEFPILQETKYLRAYYKNEEKIFLDISELLCNNNGTCGEYENFFSCSADCEMFGEDELCQSFGGDYYCDVDCYNDSDCQTDNCNDGIMNQNETAIDEGGVCEEPSEEPLETSVIRYVEKNITMDETYVRLGITTSEENIMIDETLSEGCEISDYFISEEIEVLDFNETQTAWFLSNAPNDLAVELHYTIHYDCDVISGEYFTSSGVSEISEATEQQIESQTETSTSSGTGGSSGGGGSGGGGGTEPTTIVEVETIEQYEDFVQNIIERTEEVIGLDESKKLNKSAFLVGILVLIVLGIIIFFIISFFRRPKDFKSSNKQRTNYPNQ